MAKDVSKLKRTYYRVEDDECVDFCPIHSDIRIGSYGCGECEHFVSDCTDEGVAEEKWVICSKLQPKPITTQWK